jgi:hypothetical protein
MLASFLTMIKRDEYEKHAFGFIPFLLSSAEVKECVEVYIHSPKMPSWRGA